MNEPELKKLVSGGRIIWSRHVLRRMRERFIRIPDVVEVLMSGELIEDYPADKPLPSALCFKVVSGRAIHVVVAIDEKNEYTQIVTVYEPDLDEFEADFRTRRRKK